METQTEIDPRYIRQFGERLRCVSLPGFSYQRPSPAKNYYLIVILGGPRFETARNVTKGIDYWQVLSFCRVPGCNFTVEFFQIHTDFLLKS